MMKTAFFIYSFFIFFGASCSSTSYMSRIERKNEKNEIEVIRVVDSIQIKNADDALTALKEGNERFSNHNEIDYPFTRKTDLDRLDLHPFASVLSCVDSNVSPEIIFNQGYGSIYGVRVAGNIASQDIVGSLEYAAQVNGVKVIVVLGHTSCGMVAGACKDVKMGNLSRVISEMKPAVNSVKRVHKNFDPEKLEFQDLVSEEHVKKMVQKISNNSEILKSLISFGKLKVIGAMYNAETGKVSFFF